MTQSEKDQARFKISQLQRDKIIYAIESCAITLICFFGFVFSFFYFDDPFKTWVNFSLLIIAVGYGLYMGIGNFRRLQKITELEKSL